MARKTTFTVQKIGDPFVGGKSKVRKFGTLKEATEASRFFPSSRTVIKRR